MTTAYTDIADLMAGTLRDLGRMKFEQIAQELTDYEVMGRWLQKGKIQFSGGIGIQRNLMTSTSGAASHVGMFETRTAGIGSHMAQLQVPWVHAQTAWAFERREVLMNSGEEMIYNVVVPRRTGAMIDMAHELEARAWAAPSSSDDNLVPYGMPYYLVYNATDGFTGGAATGHTTVANVNLTTHPNYKNYSKTYTDVSKSDLIKEMRTVRRAISWKSPVKSHDYSGNAGRNFCIYTNEAIVSSLEDIGEGQNENLGRDLAPYGASKDIKFDSNLQEIMFRGHPIIRVDYFDHSGATGLPTGPLYMVDHSTFYPVVLKGDYLFEHAPEKFPGNPNGFQINVDLSYNYVCINRRRNAVFATAA